MPTYSKRNERLGRPPLPKHLHKRIIGRRADMLEGFDQFCVLQLLRLKQVAVGLAVETESVNVEAIERAYRFMRLGEALSPVDRQDNRTHFEVRK